MKEQSGTAGIDIQSFFVQNHKTETQKMESILYSQSKNTYDSQTGFRPSSAVKSAGNSSSLYVDTLNILGKS